MGLGLFGFEPVITGFDVSIGFGNLTLLSSLSNSAASFFLVYGDATGEGNTADSTT